MILHLGINNVLLQLTVYTCTVLLFLCFRPVNLLTTQIQSIVRALHKQLREKSVKTRQVKTVFYLGHWMWGLGGWWWVYGVVVHL